MTNTYQSNINSTSYRLNHRPCVETTERRIARLERYLAEMVHASWTQTWQAAERELAELKGAN